MSSDHPPTVRQPHEYSADEVARGVPTADAAAVEAYWRRHRLMNDLALNGSTEMNIVADELARGGQDRPRTLRHRWAAQHRGW